MPIRYPKYKTEKTLRASLARAKARAKVKNVPFDIDMDWAIAQAERQKFECSLTGIQFFSENSSQSSRHPFTPSFDRIDCRGGYTKENVRLVIFAINAMFMDWGIDVFEQVVSGYMIRQREMDDDSAAA